MQYYPILLLFSMQIAFGYNFFIFSHCTINKSDIGYIILPVSVFLVILAYVSIYTIFLLKIFPKKHIGTAVCVPVDTITSGFIFIKRKIDFKITNEYLNK